jgi:hypothetical protein
MGVDEERGIRRTCCRDELEVVRYRRVIDERVCDHIVCVEHSDKEREEESGWRTVQRTACEQSIHSGNA